MFFLPANIFLLYNQSLANAQETESPFEKMGLTLFSLCSEKK